MALSVVATLEDGLDRLTDGRHVAAFLALYVAHLGISVGTQSQLAVQREEFGDGSVPIGGGVLPEQFPLALEMPLGAATGLWLLALLALVTASMIALRSLLVPGEPFDRPGIVLFVTVHGAVGGLLAAVAVGVGLALLVVPGLFLATALAFTYPYVATERANFLEAMRNSWTLSRGHRVRVFGVLVAVFLVTMVGGAIAVVLGAVPVVAELVSVGFGALAWLFSLAVLASAFDALEERRAAEAEKWEGVDDDLLPSSRR